MKTKKLADWFNLILKSKNLNDFGVIIVPNVKDWAILHNLKEDNSGRIAMTARRTNSKLWDIVIKSEITEDDIPSITSAMSFRGFKHWNEFDDIEKFIKHTFLHEIAHTLGVKAELDADNWAWGELGKLKP